MDSQWKIIIGAHITRPEPKYRCTCVYEGTPGEPGETWDSFVDDPSECQDYSVGGEHFECTASTEIEYVVETLSLPSDGVVLAESAMDYPGAGHVDVMPKSNHMQMRNDSNTKAKLLKLFTSGYDDYFFTLER